MNIYFPRAMGRLSGFVALAGDRAARQSAITLLVGLGLSSCGS